MDAVDRYAKLKDLIRSLEEEAANLRETFLRPNARLRSNQYEVTVRHHVRRIFLKENLPSHILSDPKYWTETTSQTVLLRSLTTQPIPWVQGEPVLIERFN